VSCCPISASASASSTCARLSKRFNTFGRLPNATLVDIPDRGHYPMLVAPDAFDAALAKFLTDE
jgi:pimeloyl-ACP methyl ester carboxylesterase